MHVSFFPSLSLYQIDSLLAGCDSIGVAFGLLCVCVCARARMNQHSLACICLCRNVDTALFDLLSYFNAINEKQ